ncbi:melanophilin-like [Denticeps clupeoides]|uniref:RabBD domain-containing protein n=1 Tax=Denticeps clupeoides TaxID=299321 RepID=A0AAY4EJ32_9TELE|nr:melanophilin-like [Denticeps clupeoides]XP_028820687.1 melanophilin-like [Denticeps clupeoides]
MIPAMAAGRNVDLSRLTDEEAKHIWQVVQRDFSLRKKEEDRLGDLKTRLEKEDTKRELLRCEASISDSLCIRCLKPFKFLVNSRRQCLDCNLHICKGCSRYNVKERGWVCDPCRMARVLKIGTLEWYHENVRSRFKRFGSATILKSLYRRMSEERIYSPADLRGCSPHCSPSGPRDEDTRSMPDIHTEAYRRDEEHTEASDQTPYRLKRNSRRVLSADLLDIDPGSGYSTNSCRETLKRPMSLERTDFGNQRGRVQEDLASIFQQIHSCFGPGADQHDGLDGWATLDDATFPDARSEHSQSVDDSDMEEDSENLFLYLPPPRRRNHASSQENLPLSTPPQINDLTKRLSAIEDLLNRLEQKMTTPVQQIPEQPSPEELEEQKLRKKLDELTGNISDKCVSSDEEEQPMGTVGGTMLPGWAGQSGSSAELQAGPTKAPLSTERHVDQFAPTEDPGRTRPSLTANFELSELEDKVALAAAKVQNTQSEMCDIQNRIAALSAAGVSEAIHRRASVTQPRRRLSHEASMGKNGF